MLTKEGMPSNTRNKEIANGYQKPAANLTSASLSVSNRASDKGYQAGNNPDRTAGLGRPSTRSVTNSSQHGATSEAPTNQASSSLNQGRSKYESTALNQLTASILEMMAQGEKSVSFHSFNRIFLTRIFESFSVK